MRLSTVFATLPLIGAAFAETITVKIGENDTLTYSPSEVTAQEGDVIAFQFLSKNHTVTQSTFNTPCTNFSATGIDSGFQPVPSNATTFMQFSFTMTNTTSPLWFYCRQTGHCEKGMVFAVNPTANKTFAQFQANALASGNATSTSSSSSPSSSSSASSSGSATSSAGSAGASNTPSSSKSGAMSVKTSGAILLSGLGLVAGLLL